MKQLPLDIGLAPSPRLDSWIPGPNAVVLARVQSVLHDSHPSLRPTYVWGPEGSGKTHLLQGVLQTLREQGREAGWLDASTPCGGYARPFDPRWSVVLLDEVDAYSPEQQHTAFNWFIHAMTPQQGEPCWVLSAGSLPVTDLPLREDLRTRLGWGQMLGLQPLSEDDVQRALRQEAQDRGLDLSDEVLRFMLSRFSRDLGSLSQLLAMLDDYALETRRAITVPLLKQMMNDS